MRDLIKRDVAESPNPEIGLFIIWSAARTDEGRILAEIRERFDIVELYEVQWSEAMISRNFSRFYRGRLSPPYRVSLEQQKGRGPFLAVVVADRSPQYGERETTGGRRVLNVKIYDTKEAIRVWTDGDYTFHSADTERTAARELVLLFGRSPNSWLVEDRQIESDRIVPWHQDPIGTDGWHSIRQMYDALSWCTAYVDLDGGHEGIPTTIRGSAVRLLAAEYNEVLSILGATPSGAYLGKWGGSFTVMIEDREVPIDVRSHNDGYIDRDWAREIIARRVMRSNGASAPANEDLFESSLYRAFVLQPNIPEQEMERLRELSARGKNHSPVELANRTGALLVLRQLMTEKSYAFVKPKDRGVFYNHRTVGSTNPGLRIAVDGFRRSWDKWLGIVLLAPLRRVGLGARDRILRSSSLLRSADGLILRVFRRSNRGRRIRSGRR